MDVREAVTFATDEEINESRLLFLDRNAADSGVVSRHEPYRSTCRLFHCGLIDRTRTLTLGFNADVVDPLENVVRHVPESRCFEELCRRRARNLIEEATSTNREIQVLWSGGIDSTVAMIALSDEAEKRNCQSQIQVLCSIDSIAEYREFFYKYIWGTYDVLPVGFPISSYLDPQSLVVTGEHGDQLYGSDFLQPYVANGLAFECWEKVLPFVFAAHEIPNFEAKQVVDYLHPLMAVCPTPIVTLFDFFWWLNFATKWQSVTLRIPANSEQPARLFEATRHFFRDLDFQHWALFTHERPRLESWREYKMPSKKFIYAYSGDAEYLATKEKEQSLRLVFSGEPQWKKDKKKKEAENRPADPAISDGVVMPCVGRVLTADFTMAYVQPVLS